MATPSYHSGHTHARVPKSAGRALPLASWVCLTSHLGLLLPGIPTGSPLPSGFSFPLLSWDMNVELTPAPSSETSGCATVGAVCLPRPDLCRMHTALPVAHHTMARGHIHACASAWKAVQVVAQSQAIPKQVGQEWLSGSFVYFLRLVVPVRTVLWSPLCAHAHSSPLGRGPGPFPLSLQP